MKRGAGETPYPSEQWKGMHDALDPIMAVPNYARLLQNVYPLDPVSGSAVVGRPGFQVAGAQLGAANKRTGQLVYQFTKRDGTTYTVTMVGGQGIYTFNWSTRVWSLVVTVANLTTKSITLSETARCYAVTFTDKLVVNDGVNTMWMWDGTSGATGLTKLTNAPVIYGQPVIYYAKLFGIKATERSTIVWSEENQPNTGYEASGYNNAWTLGQTDSEGLYALGATNEALYVFRRSAIGRIQGQVTTNFSTDGVRSDVSENVGTTSPASVLVHESGSLYFLDNLGRPQGIVAGRGLIDPPLWSNVRETIRAIDLNASSLVAAQTWYDSETRTLGIGYTELGAASASVQVSPITNEPVGIFRGYTFDRIGPIVNATNRDVLMHLSTDGYAYEHGTEDGTLWDDALNSGTVAIAHAVTSMPLGSDADTDKQWSRVDFLFRAASPMALACAYETPRGNNTAQSLSVSATGGYSVWDVAIWDTNLWSSAWLEVHKAVGWNGFGRWLAWTISHQAVGERFGLASGVAKARALNQAPGIA